jgi:hypothetical protein
MEGWNLRTVKEAEAWQRRENEWAAEALDGIADRNPPDVARINTLDWINVYPLPRGHPWRDIRANPLNCHCTRIIRLQQIEREWRDEPLARLK